MQTENANTWAVNNMRQELGDLKNLEGFAPYQEWRNSIFTWVRKLIDKADIQEATALENIADSLNDEMTLLFDLGFIHEAYKHNVFLSMELFITHFSAPEKTKELISILDMYVKPKSKKMQDFGDGFYRASSGVLIYALSKYTNCSEHLAISMSKQIFGYKSDQTVYSILDKSKKRKFLEIPLLIKLILFGCLFYKKVNWSELKPRAIHTTSSNELKNGLKSMSDFREKCVKEEIKNAQSALINSAESFQGLITPEFTDWILGFEHSERQIDDEFAFAVLFASYFGSSLKSILLPPKHFLA